MHISSKLFAFLLLAISTSTGATDAALQIIKSKDGFLFVGPKDEEKFSFDVPGQSIRTAEDDGRYFANIDGIMVQLTRYPINELPKGDPLIQHRKYETDYLKEHVA